MSDALREDRADDGKATHAHHYANEAKLINWPVPAAIAKKVYYDSPR